jgi:hypothetical protein
MMSFVPNVIDADAFDTQAAVDESTLTGERYTWRREPGTTLMKPGLVVSGEPALAFPYPTSAKESDFAAIDAAASADDIEAWRSAATVWLDYAERQYAGAREIWKQLEWGGAVSPDQIGPNKISLVNGLTFGALKLLAMRSVVPDASSWSSSFSSLRASVPSMMVTQTILTQIALRSVAWTMQSLADLGDTFSPGTLVDICDLARAWRTSVTPSCATRESPSPAPSVTKANVSKPWVKAAVTIAFGGMAGGLLAWWLAPGRQTKDT